MAEQINVLVTVKLSDEYLVEYDGFLPEDIAYYFVENLQNDFDSSGVEFELLEVY